MLIYERISSFFMYLFFICSHIDDEESINHSKETFCRGRQYLKPISIIEQNREHRSFDELKLRCRGKTIWSTGEADELLGLWFESEIRPLEPNVCITLTDYDPQWTPRRNRERAYVERFRRLVLRFLRKLGIELSAAHFDRRDCDNWPPFIGFIESKAKTTGKPVRLHAHIALRLTPSELARLGNGLGYNDEYDARGSWLRISGAYRESKNDTYRVSRIKRERANKNFHLDTNPSENTARYLAKFSGFQNNAEMCIRNTDLLCNR